MTTNYIGIDYSLGQSNVDVATGIRFGVIPAHALGQSWYDGSEAQYSDPTCGKCGNEAGDSSGAAEDIENADWYDGRDYYCASCEYCFWSDEAFGESPVAFTYDSDGIVAEQSGDDSDIFVLKSPYYTLAQFCSPCAPGAGYLLSPVTGGVKTYCFGHSWFESGVAPYPVFSVADDTEVLATR